MVFMYFIEMFYKKLILLDKEVNSELPKYICKIAVIKNKNNLNYFFETRLI